ncbi:Fur-regulated basic protein FbpA [Bacillus salipaludis]|uniref:Fur-regulated basic protein FbpA n=1 Tax=Bacillus salipaludis TaxID=2547811 RepID=UPI002E204604|nr:Fur-regulated basic protein FbpA [Bacillus salipaludis]
MKNLLRDAVEKKKRYLINKLITLGAYKKDDKHLFELTLNELEEEYSSFRKIK